jgi:hypothetical protein
MDIITREDILNLINNVEGLAVSIYMPTFPAGRRQQENPIRLKNAIKAVENQLEAMGADEGTIESYLNPLHDLVRDELFWQDQSEGLALFLDSNELRIYRLPERFDELAVAAEAFHVTPLIPVYSGNGQFYLLSLDLKHPEIYQGSKYQLIQYEDADLPESLQNMFDQFYEFHSHLQFHTKTRTPNPDIAGDREGEYFGQGGDDINENAEIRNFFHRLDEALRDFLDGDEVPLVLAGVGYLHPLFREANSNPNLMPDGITKDVDSTDPEQLHEAAWEIVRDQYQQDVDQALNVYGQLADKDKDVTTKLEEIVSAAQYQRVNSLFVAEDAHAWGRFDPDENEVELADEKGPGSQDLLSLAAAQTLKNGGNVILLPREKMPESAQVAAILRY